MARTGRRGAALVLAVALLGPAAAEAGELLGHKPKCPTASYSPCHYWFPQLYRWRAFHARLGEIPDIPNNYPDIPIVYKPVVFPCPPVDPAVMTSLYDSGSLNRPVPPTPRTPKKADDKDTPPPGPDEPPMPPADKSLMPPVNGNGAKAGKEPDPSRRPEELVLPGTLK